MNQSTNRQDRPNTVPWPPIIFAGAVAAAVILGHVYPLGGVLPSGTALRCVGAVILFTGIGFDVAAMREMRRHRANILPHRAATALVTSGPFALSRNPIYLGNTLVLTGAALLFGSLWLLLAVAAAVPAVSVLAIRREEAHLAAQFGDAWTAYAERTPRWIRLRF
nr:isoprenylcysteine carboxylmethyltransferase family protein [uncultured Rhodopila sp.]